MANAHDPDLPSSDGLRSVLGWTFVLLAATYVITTAPGVVRRHNADSVLPIFVSLDLWSLFYWGQDRFGMLLPLLARPVRDSFANLMVQNLLTVGIFLAGTVAAFARLEVPKPPLSALLLVTILMVCSPPLTVFMFFTTNQSYAPAIGCFGLALYVYREQIPLSILGALVLMAIGTWTNGGVGLFATLTALMLVVARVSRVRLVMLVGGIISLGCHIVLQRLAPPPINPTEIHWPVLSEIPVLLWRFLSDAAAMIGWPLGTVCFVLWIAAMLTRRSDDRWWRRDLFAAALAIVAYACLMAVPLLGLGRHMLSVLPLLVAIPLVPLLRIPMVNRLSQSRTALVAVLAALVIPIGIHMPKTVRRDLIEGLGRGHEIQMYTQGVQAITGDYWDVWSITFAVNMVHEQRSGRRPVVPVALRSEPLAKKQAAALKANAKVGIVPAGHLIYWFQRGLPRLRIVENRKSYSLAAVAGEQTAMAPAATHFDRPAKRSAYSSSSDRLSAEPTKRAPSLGLTNKVVTGAASKE